MSFEQMLSEQGFNDGVLFLDAIGTAQLFIVEGTTGGPTKFRGKFQEANNPNKNKREYPYDVLRSNVDRLIETINARGLVGELDHPTDSIIHFEKASHIITQLWWEGNVLMGEGEILPTPHGRILESLIQSGVRVGISSRGVGNGKVRPQDGVLVIGESYKLITFDAVADPSTFSAYQKIVTGSQRRESINPFSVMPEAPMDIVNSSGKNEGTGINTVNNEAFVAYIGQLIRHHIDKIKEEI
jgi:hypothetical protein